MHRACKFLRLDKSIVTDTMDERSKKENVFQLKCIRLSLARLYAPEESVGVWNCTLMTTLLQLR
jgi:hypothetical protein